MTDLLFTVLIIMFAVVSISEWYGAVRHMKAHKRKARRPGLSDWREWQKGVFK